MKNKLAPKKNILLIVSILFFKTILIAQSSVQNVRGIVVDKISQSPLPGVAVVITNGTFQIGNSTDLDGNFKIKEVPVGKISLKITYMGYKEIFMQNVVLNAGKELVLNINLEEDIKAINEVVITAKEEKNKPLNAMSTVSTRTFSVEETQKFAAAVNDPARMATSFAGVVQAGDGNNHIAIRGNSPNGLLWRMEGVEIPNPNHFSSVGTSGGGISILSAQLLSNSDFSTGAFAAEYGNALSGVFDLRLRKGNNEKREYTMQLGILGADIAAEGPFKAGYNGSYLINYRYSTLNLLGKIGVPMGDAITNFQDLSYNIFLPTEKLGNFSLFGFAGQSYQIVEAKKDSLQWKEDSYYQYDSKFYANTGAFGASNTKLFNNQSYLKTVLMFSGTENGFNNDKLSNDYVKLNREFEEAYTQTKITLSSTYTKKLNAKNNIRTGFILNQLGYQLLQKSLADTNVLITKINTKGNTHSVQGFFQWNNQINQRLSTNVGLHYFQLLLNNSYAIEPRAALKFELNHRQNLTLGYGLHSQIQPIGVYFAETKNESNVNYTPNSNLPLSRAHHVVLGYDWNINDHEHIKTEFYYQHLFNVPISKDTNNTFSMLNITDGYNTSELQSTGLGKNYGMELTYERFLFRNLYYLVSGSIFESKYRAANNIWYNSRFNTNYNLTVTLGKEWTLSEKRKRKVLGFNVKSIYTGGFRNTPIDLNNSIEKGYAVYDYTQTYTLRNPDYFRLDLRVSLKRNYAHMTTTLSLDLQNATNRKNVGGQFYNEKTASVKWFYQAPLIPILSYKVEF
jgi:hypothetical protein